MTREEAYKLVDELFDLKEKQSAPTTTGIVTPTSSVPEETKRELPKDKRVVRTKTSGDRVYLLDDVKKTRQWITNPDVLKNLGFEMGDVQEVSDMDLLKYQMSAALYKVEQNAQS